MPHHKLNKPFAKNIILVTVMFLVIHLLTLDKFYTMSSITCGPCSTSDLKGSPTTRFSARFLAFSTNSSNILSCTKVRDPAAQHCPYINNMKHDKNVLIQTFLLLIKITCVFELPFLGTWLKKRAKCACSTASSTLASSHIINGDFPPSSKVTGLRLLFAAACRTICPVSVDPVKASYNKRTIKIIESSK